MQMGMHGQNRSPPEPRNKFSAGDSAEGQGIRRVLPKKRPGHYDRVRLEVRLNLLSAQWRFVLNSIDQTRRVNGCHDDPSVPMSVSRPFSSSKGMEYL